MNLWSKTGCCFAYFNGHLIFVDLLNNDVQYTGAQQILIKPQLKTKFKKKIIKKTGSQI